MIRTGSNSRARRCCASRISLPRGARSRRPHHHGATATRDRPGGARTDRAETTQMPAGTEPAMEPDTSTDLAELAGGFIHEIKNHLSTLGLNLQLLAEDFQDPQSQRERRAVERVQRLQTECQRLLDLSNDFLRFARVKDLELAPSNLATVIEEMCDFFGPMARQANIDIKCYIPADLPGVKLNPELFKQALLNLMLNATQAMPQGGELTIQATPEPPLTLPSPPSLGGEGRVRGEVC